MEAFYDCDVKIGTKIRLKDRFNDVYEGRLNHWDLSKGRLQIKDGSTLNFNSINKNASI